MLRVLSPDGFDLEMDGLYPTQADALAALNRFRARYQKQGYYSTGNRVRIALEDLADCCEIIAV